MADSANQILLLIGGRRARRVPSRVEPVILAKTLDLGPDELLPTWSTTCVEPDVDDANYTPLKPSAAADEH